MTLANLCTLMFLLLGCQEPPQCCEDKFVYETSSRRISKIKQEIINTTSEHKYQLIHNMLVDLNQYI